MHYNVLLETEYGSFLARFSDKGLSSLAFPGKAQHATETLPPSVREWSATTGKALHCVLKGKEPNALPPLDLNGTKFQQAVWKVLRQLKPGKTASYGQIASRLGKPRAARAVGTACGANPIPLFVPCHRVLAAGGKLGGFSGGLDWKKRLLELENTRLSA